MFSKKTKLKLISLIIGASIFSGIYLPTNCLVASAETVSVKETTSDGFKGYDQSFEDGLGNWNARGNAVVKQDSSQYKEGSNSLKVSSRTTTWEGPVKDLTNVLTKGKTYHFSVYVMYNDANGASTQIFDLKFANTAADKSEEYVSVASAKATKGTWTEIQGDYTIPSDADLSKYSLYLELPYKSNASITPAEKIDFYLDNVAIKEIEKDYQKDIPQLKNVFSDYFPIGTAVTGSELNSTDIHSEFIKYQYNALVAGNSMKPEALQPTEGNFKWDDADQVVQYATDNDMVLRGHTLVWHNQTPDWFFQDPSDSTKPASRELLLKRLKTHIDTVMARYKGKIDYWDVVNEVISDSTGLRASKWKSIVGDVDKDGYDSDYIELAFKYAHEADPDAKLIINDYNIEWNATKRDTLYNLVKRMLQKGIPVDGVGLQMHIAMYNPSVSTIKESIEKYASLKSIDPNFLVQVTELDMSIYNSSGEGQKTVNDYILDTQASRYKELFEMFKEESVKGNLGLVMLWGNSDDDTWLDNFPVSGRKDAPLLFDRYLQAKPAYYSVVGLPKPTPPPIPPTPTVSKQTVNTINATPTIGDFGDKKWQMAIPFDVKTYVTGTSGATAKVKTMWDTNNLYVFADVADATASNSDSVDIYLDNGNSGYNKYTANRIIPDTIKVAQTAGDTDTVKVYEKGTSYQIQAKLPLSNIQAANGTKLTFDMKINDYDLNRNLNSSIVWIDKVSKDTLSFNNGGTLSLSKEPKLVEAKKGTPTIDGNTDTIWSNANIISTDVILKDADTAKANVKLLWDENYVYALYEVTDHILNKTAGNKYDQDSVEAFIDENNAKSSSYDSDDAQYRVNFDNEQSGSANGAIKNTLFKSATKLTDTGYMVEMAIPLNNKGSLNQIIGFDAQVNDATASVRKGVNLWCDGSNNTWSTMVNAGNVLFVNSADDSKVLLGDVNDDGKIDISDYIQLQKYILNPQNVINKTNSDITGDSKINTADLFALRKICINS